tara:strand:+ start:7615 stop:7749 length:135 start_codon:yes stop_codon:yes gene_type:complete
MSGFCKKSETEERTPGKRRFDWQSNLILKRINPAPQSPAASIGE